MDYTIHTPETASDRAAKLLKGIESGLGFIPNIFAVIAESEPALEGFVMLNEKFARSSFTEEERQIILLATSTENQCIYCVAGHTAFAQRINMSKDVVNAMREYRTLDDERLNALNVLVRALVKGKGQVDQSHVKTFLEAGYTKTHFMELVLGICVKTFSNYVSNALSIPLDEAFQNFTWQRPQKAT